MSFELEVFPQILPPTGHVVPVHVVGLVGVSLPVHVPPTVNFQIVDDYRKIQSIGLTRVPVRPSPIGPEFYEFSVVLPLQASVAPEDESGRQYVLIFSAQDPDNAFGQIRPVLVPNPPTGPVVEPIGPPPRFTPTPRGPRPVPPRFDPRFSPRPPTLPPRVPAPRPPRS